MGRQGLHRLSQHLHDLGARTFERLRGVNPADVVHLPEDRICVTINEMLNVEGIVLEPAGALSIDALGEVADQIAGKTVVCVASGGNFDFERLPEVKERAQRYSGVKKYFILHNCHVIKKPIFCTSTVHQLYISCHQVTNTLYINCTCYLIKSPIVCTSIVHFMSSSHQYFVKVVYLLFRVCK